MILQIIGGISIAVLVAIITTRIVNAKHDRDEEIISLHRLVSDLYHRQDDKLEELLRDIHTRIDHVQEEINLMRESTGE